MVRLSNKSRKNKNTNEETVGLVNGNSPPRSPPKSAAPASGSFSRYWHLVWIVLIGCLALYVWESIEWDENTGDVQLKLHSGSKQGGEDGDGEDTPVDDVTKKTADDDTEVKEKLPEEDAEGGGGEPETPAETTTTATEAPKEETTTTTTPVVPAAATETPAVPAPPATETPAVPAATAIPAVTDTTTTADANNAASAECQQQCSSVTADTTRFDGMDLTVAANMRTRLATYRQKWIDEFMKVEYGEYYENIFEPNDPTTNTRVHIGKQKAFKSPNMLNLPNHKSTETSGIGWTRMIRKYQMKLLQVQLGMLEEKLNPTQYCETYQCAPPTEGHQMKPNHYAKFLWVNGGHSASAGHGNFYPESYTANLGRDLAPILKEIGLDWMVKNYAMGGTESGEEVALCHNQVFGKDVDSLSWDYGMTDGHEHNKMSLYAYRTARLSQLDDSFSQPGNIKHRPSLVGIHHNDDVTEVLQIMMSLGMTAIGMDWPFERESIEASYPDMFGMSNEQILGLPPSVQYFKCQGKIEAGEPGCQTHKYNETMCPTRKAKASWHPGKKYHALVGHMLAFTVLEVFDQALEVMAQSEPSAPETPDAKRTRLQQQLGVLDAQEQADYDRIFQSPVPPKVVQWFDAFQWKGDNKDRHKEQMKVMNLDWFIKDPVLCHTAMLPAEIRYRGILTENSNQVGTVLDKNWEHAILQTTIEETENPNPTSGRQPGMFKDPRPERGDVMVLGAKNDERDRCDAMTNADVKDYFYVSNKEFWRWLKLPNNAEKTFYTEFDASKSHGYFFICMAKCDWGRCPKGDIRQNVMDFSKDPEYGGMNMEINLVKVTSLNCMNSCCALKHDDPVPANQFVWQPTAEGKLEFRAMIEGGFGYGYARFSSFILL